MTSFTAEDVVEFVNDLAINALHAGEYDMALHAVHCLRSLDESPGMVRGNADHVVFILNRFDAVAVSYGDHNSAYGAILGATSDEISEVLRT